MQRRKKKPQAALLTVHRPESQLRRPVELFRSMIRDLLASRELAWQLTKRNISAQYRQSFLGILWAFIPPVIAAAGLTFARSSGVVNIQETDLPYPAYVMFSMTLWQTFVEALTGPLQAISGAKTMLVRINFPREALILTKLGELFFNFGIKLTLIVGLFVWYRIPITWSVILAPVALIHLILFGTFIGLIVATAGALYQDFSKAIPLVTGFWLLITPVIYPPLKGGLFGKIVQLNPITPLLVTTRELATTGVISDPQGFWISSLIGIFGLLFAWLIYRLAIPYIVERMSS
ncbi:MAG: ABC transporter permease [Phormidesmis sp.]